MVVALVSFPMSISFRKNPYAIIVTIKKLWWAHLYNKNIRAGTIGQLIMLGPNIEDKDLEHEIIHVIQHQRNPIIQPFLYIIESIRHGYRNNKYEVEAYNLAGNNYKGKNK